MSFETASGGAIVDPRDECLVSFKGWFHQKANLFVEGCFRAFLF